jgi:predicted nuclease with TOPRIM domain
VIVRISFEAERGEVVVIGLKKNKKIELTDLEELRKRVKDIMMQRRKEIAYPSFVDEQMLTESELEDVLKYLDEQEARRSRIEEKIELILEAIKKIKKRKKGFYAIHSKQSKPKRR